MLKVLISFLFVLFFSQPIFARERVTAPPPEDASFTVEMERMREEHERMAEEIKKREMEELERLRATDPELYEKRKRQIEINERIEEIVISFREGRISEAAAVKQLYPLMREQTREYIDDYLKLEIERLDKRLDFLKRVEKDPDILIQRRINQILGKTPFYDEF